MFFSPVPISEIIPAAASQTGNIRLGNLVLDTILVPSAWDTANITFLVSQDGTNFFPLFDAAGNEVVLTAAAGRAIRFPPYFRIGFPFLRVRSGTNAVPVSQTAARAIEIRGIQV